MDKKISWDIFGKYNSVYVYKELSAAGVANQVLVLQISDKRRAFFAQNGVPVFASNGVPFFTPKLSHFQLNSLTQNTNLFHLYLYSMEWSSFAIN